MSIVERTSSILLILLFVVGFIAPAVPVHAQQMSISISPSHGIVGTNVTVTGTIETYNGDYEIYFDGITKPEWSGTAEGYKVSDTITVPNATWGSHDITLKDVSSDGTAVAKFTVDTNYTLNVDVSRNYEGGPFTFMITITGGRADWGSAAYVKLRFVAPDGSVVETTDMLSVEQVVSDSTPVPGLFTGTYHTEDDTNLITHGTYTAYLDVDIDGDGSIADTEKGLAHITFAVGLSNLAEVQRTQTVKFRAYVPSGVTGDKYVIKDPTGSVVATIDVENTGEGNFMPKGEWLPAKGESLGTYTVEALDTENNVISSDTFKVIKATLTVVVIDEPLAGEEIERTLSVSATFKVEYPDQTALTNLDLPNGFTVKVYVNGTLVTEIKLDPKLNYSVDYNEWTATWKIPKDQAVGDGYSFNVTVNAIEDAYGNTGPGEYVSTNTFKVEPAVLAVTTPELRYPATGVTLQRTETAKASVEITYPDGSLFTPDDLGVVNVTVDGPSEDYIVTLTAEDYNSDLGVWIVKWHIPWNASIVGTASYSFYVNEYNVVDKYGNKGPSPETDPSSQFYVEAATIAVTNLKTDKTEYESGETIYVTFDALYPDGSKVVNGEATVELSGTSVTGTAKYDSDLGKWYVAIDIPSDQSPGSYNITIEANALNDGAGNGGDNTGPASKTYVEVSVIKIIVIEVDVAIGSVHFGGETVEAYAIARFNGAPYDLPPEAFTATVYLPDDSTATATVTKVTTGLFKISYTLPSDAPEGGYAISVTAKYKVAPYTYARGFGVKSFSVSPTFNNWNNIMSSIPAEFSNLNASIADVLNSLSSIQSQLDSLSTSVADLTNSIATLSDELNSLSTAVDTGLSSVLSQLDSLSTSVADLTNSTATLQSAVSDLESSVSSISKSIASLSDQLSSVSNAISDGFNSISTKLNSISDTLNSLSTTVNSGFSDLSSTLGSISSSLSEVSGKLDSLQSGLSDLSTSVSSGFSKVSSALDGLKSGLSDLKSGISGIQSGLSDLSDAMAKSASDTASFLLATIVLVIITLIFAAVAAIKVFRS